MAVKRVSTIFREALSFSPFSGPGVLEGRCCKNMLPRSEKKRNINSTRILVILLL